MNNWTNPGLVIKLVAPVGGVAALQGYIVGDLFVISKDTRAEGEQYAAIVDGEFEMVKKTGDAATEGARVYWDDAGKEVSTVSGDMPIGVATRAAAGGDATIAVRLDGTGAAEPASASLFVSTLQTGTGAQQLIAHGLGAIPSGVTVHIYSGHDGAGGLGTQAGQAVEGAHDATNVDVNVTNGVQFKVTAYV